MKSIPAKLPMAASNLDQAIQQYDAALKLLSNQPTQAQIVLDVLTARDRVQAVLEAFSTSADCLPPVESLKKISILDTRLKEQASAIAPLSADWRTSFNPDQKAWWWFLEAPKNSWSDRLDWVWSTISVTCLTISLGLIGDIAPRFLTGGPDSFGAITVSAQSVLTLIVAGGALTQAGQETLKRFLKAINCPEKYWHELGVVGALLLVLGFFVLRQSLPQIATTFYTNPGIKSYKDGNWSTAEEKFKRAIQLNADDTLAHFQLGKLYEDLQLPDQARPQYLLAIQGDNPDVTNTATNNLARLNILKKDYPAAVSLLLKALDTEKKSPLDPKTKHAVLKNLGWARLKQGKSPDAEFMLREAKTKLEEAIKLQSTLKLERAEIAAAHCLLAQVMEAQGDKKGALTRWNNCNRYANITIPEQDEWAAIARKRITEESRQ